MKPLLEAPPVALVTGAGRGIGRACALAFAREGLRLCLAARTREELEATRVLSGLHPIDSLIVLIDLAQSEAAGDLVRAALDHFGRIDILVNNAGWAPPRRPLLKLSAAEEQRMIAINLHTPIALARLVAPQMAKRGTGTIINIASTAARLTPPGEAVYAAAKAGLIAFTHAAFAELRNSGVRVAAIVPGLVDTGLVPGNKHLARERMLAAEDVAEAVLQVVNSSERSCPVEIVLQPQRDPLRAVPLRPARG